VLIDASRKLPSTASGGDYRARKSSELLAKVGSHPSENIRELDRRITSWKILEDVLLVIKIEGAFFSMENAAIHQESTIAPPTRTLGSEVIQRLISNDMIERLPKRIKIVAAVSDDVNLESDMEVIWGVFTRFDAARDIAFTSTSLVGVNPLYEGVMGIDATWKVGYPNPCELPA
jgi:hypothetical protein